MSAVRVSALIPFYNRPHEIGPVVDCLLRQTRPPDEVIVVDDASTVDCQSALDSLPARVMRHERNAGPAAARNTAFAASTGDIVVFVDSDAYAGPRMIERLLQVYEDDRDPRLGGVGGRGIESREESIYDVWRKLHGGQDFGSVYRREVDYLYGLCCSFRRKALEQVGGFDPFFPINAGEDLDLGYRLQRAGYYLSYQPEAFVYHQHRDTRESLLRVQYNWVYWNYLTRKRNGLPVRGVYLGVFKRLLLETAGDLLVRRSPRLAALDLAIFARKLSALRAARRASLQAA